VAADYSPSDWAPGPSGEWSGDCAKLTASSFTRGAGVGYRRGNAIDQYNGYKSAGLVYGGIPRHGDPVFYNIAAPYGHTAIYIGGTTVVTTQGMDFARQPVARRDLHSFANYLGWARV
jgi:cell wall-associated NlpC family hydrolase